MSDWEHPLDHAELHSTPKRSLLVLSHAMERAFDARPVTEADSAPGLVLALFQRREYFDREVRRYGKLAARGSMVVVGFVGSVEGLPGGVHGVALEAADPLAREWSLILLGGGYGSALNAEDAFQLADGELTLQASRLFSARWTFRRDVAAAEARRLLELLAAALPAAVVAAARVDILRAESTPVTAVEAQLSAAANHLVTSLDAGNQRAVRLRVALEDVQALAERDQLTGLHNRHYLERFLGSGDDGPADLAVLLVDVDNLKTVNDRFGHRAGDAVLTAVARTLRTAVRPGDVVIRWGGDEFLLLAPGLPGGDALALADRLTDAVRRTVAEEPWDELPLSASIGVCVAARTTLPLAALDAALYSVKRTGKGRAALAATDVLAGDTR